MSASVRHQNQVKKTASASCSKFLKDNEKARWQWNLEERFRDFENSHN